MIHNPISPMTPYDPWPHTNLNPLRLLTTHDPIGLPNNLLTSHIQGADPNITTGDDVPLLHFAVRNLHSEAIPILIQEGATVNKKGPKYVFIKSFHFNSLYYYLFVFITHLIPYHINVSSLTGSYFWLRVRTDQICSIWYDITLYIGVKWIAH